MEHVYALSSTYNLNMPLSVYSVASQFTGAVFLFWCCYLDAHTIGCPFLCVWIMWMGCTSPVFTFLSFVSDSGLVHLFTKWVITVFGIPYSGQRNSPCLMDYAIQMRIDTFMQEGRIQQSFDHLTFDSFWACRRYCFYWGFRCCPACLRRPLYFLLLSEWNLLQCSVSVL